MNVQSSGGVSAYFALSKTNAQPANAKSSAASGEGVNVNSTDQVTLSDAAQKIIADDGGTTQHRSPLQERYLRSSMSDLASAQKLASDMALGPSTILVNIQGTVPGDPSRLASTGRVIDDDFKTSFYAQSSKIDAARRDIYYSETAKGTNPVAIIAKMIDFTNSQSRDYLEATAQLYPTSVR
jgi:hypothetical protein